MSTVLEMKSGYNVLCTFIYIVNRVVSGEIYTTGKNFTAAGSDGMNKSHLCGAMELFLKILKDEK